MVAPVNWVCWIGSSFPCGCWQSIWLGLDQCQLLRVFVCLFCCCCCCCCLFVCFCCFFNQAALRLWILYGLNCFDDEFMFICKVLLSAYSTEVWRMWLKCLVPKQKGMFTLHSKHHSVWYFTVQEGGVPSLILTSTKKIGVLHVIQIRWKIRFSTGSDPFW